MTLFEAGLLLVIVILLSKGARSKDEIARLKKLIPQRDATGRFKPKCKSPQKG